MNQLRIDGTIDMDVMEHSEYETLAVKDVVTDPAIYPRSEWSASTVERYAEAYEAGASFPPIILERGTNRLLDGMHRYQAHRQRGAEFIEVERHIVPNGIPAKLYAASLSAQHGDRITKRELQDVARDTIHANPDFSMKVVAQMLGITRQTVSRWVGDITERRREVRKVKALILSRAGWTQEEIGEELGVPRRTIGEDVNSNISANLTEDLLREASEGLPDEFAETIVAIREELIFAMWDEEELTLLRQLRQGETVVVNMSSDGHPNLVQWTQDTGVFVRIDRRTEWGNPFLTPDDGDRDSACDNYEHHYLPYKLSLHRKRDDLKGGKALGCWCAPLRCHGHVLKAWAEDEAS